MFAASVASAAATFAASAAALAVVEEKDGDVICENVICENDELGEVRNANQEWGDQNNEKKFK